MSKQSGAETSLGIGAMNSSTSVNLSYRREKLKTQGELGLEASSVDYMPSLGLNSAERSV